MKGFRDVLYCTMNKGSKAMSKVLKVVFAAFTQHFIQSNGTHVTHVGGVESVLYSIYKAPHPFKFTSLRRQFYFNFMGLINYKGYCR